MAYLLQKSRTQQSFAIVGGNFSPQFPFLTQTPETIYVETVLKNPLNIPLQFTEMRLICTHTHSGTKSEEGVCLP